jgi:hypothetical protein
MRDFSTSAWRFSNMGLADGSSIGSSWRRDDEARALIARSDRFVVNDYCRVTRSVVAPYPKADNHQPRLRAGTEVRISAASRSADAISSYIVEPLEAGRPSGYWAEIGGLDLELASPTDGARRLARWRLWLLRALTPDGRKASGRSVNF